MATVDHGAFSPCLARETETASQPAGGDRPGIGLAAAALSSMVIPSAGAQSERPGESPGALSEWRYSEDLSFRSQTHKSDIGAAERLFPCACALYVERLSPAALFSLR